MQSALIPRTNDPAAVTGIYQLCVQSAAMETSRPAFWRNAVKHVEVPEIGAWMRLSPVSAQAAVKRHSVGAETKVAQEVEWVV